MRYTGQYRSGDTLSVLSWDGEYRVVKVMSNVYLDEQGRPVYKVGVFHNGDLILDELLEKDLSPIN